MKVKIKYNVKFYQPSNPPIQEVQKTHIFKGKNFLQIYVLFFVYHNHIFRYKKIWQTPIFTMGNPLLSSAITSLTAVFGMGTGVPSYTSSPEILCIVIFLRLLILSSYFFYNTLKNIQQPIFYLFLVKPSIYQYWSTQYITALTSPAYLTRVSSCDLT